MNRRKFLHGLSLTVISTMGIPSFLHSNELHSAVKSADGTPIVLETSGAGPNLVLVHGGVGDHTRWSKLLPMLTPRFTVSAMDRRGHGASGDSLDYSLQREAEDIACVIESRRGKVNVLAHSYGAMCAYEAAFLTKNVSKLVLYEPPFQVGERFIDLEALAQMEALIDHGRKEEALILFLSKIVRNRPTEIAAAKNAPSWKSRVADIHWSVREVRAVDTYKFDAARADKLRIPTLLLTGSETAAQHKRAITALQNSLPIHQTHVFNGQGHNAIDTAPEQFARVVTDFLLSAS